MNHFFRPCRSVRYENTTAPNTEPARYADAVSPTSDSKKCNVAVWVRMGPMAATMDTSSPSNTHVIPSAVTTSQCHRDHGSWSIRCGMLVVMGVAGGEVIPYRITDRNPGRKAR